MSVWFTVPGMSLDEARSSHKSSSPSISSAAGSPARTSAPPEPGLGSQGPEAAFGLSISESFALFGPDGWLSRTLGLFGGGGSEPFSGDWPKSGMMLNGRCYRRKTWEPRIFVRGSSSSRGFPTPRASDARSPGPSPTAQGAQCLNVAVCYNSTTRRTWSTPMAADAKSVKTQGIRANGVKVPSLTAQVKERASGALNPDFVDLLMGFPAGYTQAPIPKRGSEE